MLQWWRVVQQSEQGGWDALYHSLITSAAARNKPRQAPTGMGFAQSENIDFPRVSPPSRYQQNPPTSFFYSLFTEVISKSLLDYRENTLQYH